MPRPLPFFLLLAVFLPSCGRDRAEGAHVVLVLVDQLRADSAREWMPEVRSLADQGVVFENARAVAPWTYPSVISMFSGLYPQQHGADGPPGPGKILSTFDARLPLLPHQLRRAGYHTAGFVTNPFLHTWNPFHEGFDHYEVDEFIGSEGNLIGQPELVWKDSMFSDTVNAHVLDYFDDRPVDQPEFTYVHYIDVHGPHEGAPFETTGDMERDYAIATRFVDGKIRELYDYFLERYDGRLIFIVTSDHGQELGDDLRVGEGSWPNGRGLRFRKRSMHEFNLHIPLWILPSEVVPGPRVVSTSCGNLDLYPTVLDWLGFEVPESIRGKSLLPAILGEKLEERPIYARQSAFNRLEDAVIHDGKKYIRLFDPANRREAVDARRVFDLEQDPREENVLPGEFGEVEGLLEHEAGTDGVEYPRSYEEPPGEVLDQLQKIGYLGDEDSEE